MRKNSEIKVRNSISINNLQTTITCYKKTSKNYSETGIFSPSSVIQLAAKINGKTEKYNHRREQDLNLRRRTHEISNQVFKSHSLTTRTSRHSCLNPKVQQYMWLSAGGAASHVLASPTISAPTRTVHNTRLWQLAVDREIGAPHRNEDANRG